MHNLKVVRCAEQLFSPKQFFTFFYLSLHNFCAFKKKSFFVMLLSKIAISLSFNFCFWNLKTSRHFLSFSVCTCKYGKFQIPCPCTPLQTKHTAFRSPETGRAYADRTKKLDCGWTYLDSKAEICKKTPGFGSLHKKLWTKFIRQFLSEQIQGMINEAEDSL